MKNDKSHLDANKTMGEPGEDGGMWQFNKLRVIASWGGGWDHVSVSHPTRTPLYEEMEWIREKFFEDDEVVMQLSVARADHINTHVYCLHMWRPQDQEIPMPPKEFV